MKFFEKPRITQEHGLTLLEMMIALVIFAVGILGILGIQTRILVGNDFSGYNTVARSIGKERMDSLLFTAFVDPDLNQCPPGVYCHRDTGSVVGAPPNLTDDIPPYAQLDEVGFIAANGRFRRDWTIQPAPSPFDATAKLIQVRVQWNDVALTASPKNRTLVFSSILPQK